MTPTFAIPAELHLLKHPFYQAWMAGTLSQETLQDYAQQYYHHVEAFPIYLQKALAHSSTKIVQSILKENLAEEDGTTYGISHPELWLRFAEGLGAPRSSVQLANLRRGIKNVVKTFSEKSDLSLAAALGCLYAYESQVPEIAESKIEGLIKHYGIHDEKSLSFYIVHKTADIAHRESLLKIINCMSKEEKSAAQKAADEASQALWDFLTDVSHTSH